VSMDQHSIMVTTLVSNRDRSGRVQIEGPNIKAQLSADEARDLAANILQAATFAEADAFLFAWVQQVIGGDEAAAAGLLQEFRQFREARVARPVDEPPRS
jgi:hypothetical protein